MTDESIVWQRHRTIASHDFHVYLCAIFIICCDLIELIAGLHALVGECVRCQNYQSYFNEKWSATRELQLVYLDPGNNNKIMAENNLFLYFGFSVVVSLVWTINFQQHSLHLSRSLALSLCAGTRVRKHAKKKSNFRPFFPSNYSECDTCDMAQHRTIIIHKYVWMSERASSNPFFTIYRNSPNVFRWMEKVQEIYNRNVVPECITSYYAWLAMRVLEGESQCVNNK